MSPQVRKDKLAEYRRRRERFFGRYGHQWPTTLADPFDLLEVYRLEQSDIAMLRSAAAGLASLYAKVAKLVKAASDHGLSELGVPPQFWRIIRNGLPSMHDCVLGRFDFARTRTGYKMLEFNSDGAGLVVEAFSVNRAACREEDCSDPNEGCEAMLREDLYQGLRAGLAYVGKSEHEANLVVACAGSFERDVAEAVYLSKVLEPFPVQFALLDKLSVDTQGLYDPNGRQIDVLFKKCNLKIVHTAKVTNRGNGSLTPLGPFLHDHIESRRLALINPPAACLLENKAVQAVIWNLFETDRYFDANERHVIATYMLPTYLDHPLGQGRYVLKPVYGAEGDSIQVLDGKAHAVCKSASSTYSGKPAVYQQHVKLPQEELMTEYGPRILHLVTSCFVVAGKPSAICMRAGDAITNEMAWVVPLGVQD
jgi:glutathionylspermidine synthase